MALVTGIASIVRADLGAGSWQVLETGLVETFGRSFTTVTLIEAAVALALAMVWLGQRPWIATVVLAFAGAGIDPMLELLETPSTVPGQIGLFAAGTISLTVGVAFYLSAALGASAQDALFVGIYERYELRPGVVRFWFDAVLVVGGIALGGAFGPGTFAITVAMPALIEPAMRVGHRLAGTEAPRSLRSTTAV